MKETLKVVAHLCLTHGQEQACEADQHFRCKIFFSPDDLNNHDIGPNKCIKTPKSRTRNNSLKSKKSTGNDHDCTAGQRIRASSHLEEKNEQEETSAFKGSTLD